MNINPYVYPGLKQDYLPYKLRNKKIIKASLEEILKSVSETSGVSVEDILSRTRKLEIVDARHIFCGIARDHHQYTLKTIGNFLNRDHTTAMHAVKNFHNRSNLEEGYQELVDKILERIVNKYY